jgi:CBS-domain-containing membrane protein
MSHHQVRRLPVIDGDRLVGIVSQADIARNVPDELVGDLVSAISSGPSSD